MNSRQLKRDFVKCALFALASFVVVSVSAAAPTSSPVTFESPCECRDNHGKGRWSVKNDPATPPTDASAIQSVSPSDIFSWAMRPRISQTGEAIFPVTPHGKFIR
jgi:hypothetical protein